MPEDWKVLGNAPIKDSVRNGGFTQYVFDQSDKLPTYLFAFTAGKFNYIKRELRGQTQEFIHRETDSSKVKNSIDSIFINHSNAISFLESWTGIPFPFKKVGYVAIPDFQFGGMEHPGAVEYKSSSFFLDEGATKDMLISRANLISHETAHMWFGDMVTMKWFNDVWMKEVFANFMADKVTQKVMGTETFDLKFLQDHYPAAYNVDRTRGANPIRQQLDNLKDAGSLYGNIIYHKAPIMMMQLELLMGEEPFRAGICEYLKKYQYSNATWNDLISILSRHTKSDLYSWNKVWVNQTGRPVFNYQMSYSGSKVNKITITQKSESGGDRVWPQSFKILLVYPNHSKELTIHMTGKTFDVQEIKGSGKPTDIILNSDGKGYGIFPSSIKTIANVVSYNNPVTRASVYISTYENMLAGKSFSPSEVVHEFSKGLTIEKNEMNLRLLSNYISNIFWSFLSAKERNEVVEPLEKSLWSAIEMQDLPNNKKNLFRTYQEIYKSEDANEKMYSIWDKQIPPAGVKLSEDDYTSLALTIALKDANKTNVIDKQIERIKNEERKSRLRFLKPALSNEVSERNLFFESLSDLSNREKESWVATGLGYLNHPLRQTSSIKYLKKSLDLVEEIQRTGDVFFPQSWLGAIFSNYQSKEALNIVDQFLKDHPNYNPKLKGKILQATDNLYRFQHVIRH
ncbi:MAG: M1 family aminopeptidase [Ginsengibacter sp.]